MIMKNKNVWLVLAVIQVISFSMKAMVEVVRPIDETRSTNGAGVELKRGIGSLDGEGRRNSGGMQRLDGFLSRTLSHVDDTNAGRPEVDEHTEIQPVERAPQGQQVSGGDVDIIPLTETEQTKMRELESGRRDFSEQARHQDPKSVIEQKQEELRKFQEQVARLEELQTSAQEKHTKISEEITALEARIKDLESKVLQNSTGLPQAPKPVIITKKPGFFAKLFGRKKTTVGTESSNQEEGAQKVKPGFFDRLAISKVLKNENVARDLESLPKGTGYPDKVDVVNDIVMLLRMGKTDRLTPEVILETILSKVADRSKLTFEEEEKYQQLVVDVYYALFKSKKLSFDTDYFKNINGFGKKLSTIVMSAKNSNGIDLTENEVWNKLINDNKENEERESEKQEIVNEIIRQLRAGNSPQQAVIVAQERLKTLRAPDLNEQQVTAYRELADTVLNILIKEHGITAEAYKKIQEQQSTEITKEKTSLVQLREQKEQLSDKREAGLMAKQEYEQKITAIQEELKQAQAEEAEQRLSQEVVQNVLTGVKGELKAQEVARIKGEQVNAQFAEIVKRREIRKKTKELEIQQTAAKIAETRAVENRTFGKLLLKTQKEQETLKATLDAQEAARLQAEAAAKKEANERTAAEAKRLQVEAEAERLQAEKEAKDKIKAHERITREVVIGDDASEDKTNQSLTKFMKTRKKPSVKPKKEKSISDQFNATRAMVGAKANKVLDQVSNALQQASGKLTRE